MAVDITINNVTAKVSPELMKLLAGGDLQTAEQCAEAFQKLAEAIGSATYPAAVEFIEAARIANTGCKPPDPRHWVKHEPWRRKK